MLLKWDETMKAWVSYWMKDREPTVANEGFQLIVSDLKDNLLSQCYFFPGTGHEPDRDPRRQARKDHFDP
jgi:hypothetical protein